MSVKKPWKHEERDHVKSLEIHKAGEVWGGFVRRHEIEVKNREEERLKAEQEAARLREQEAHNNQTCEERRGWLELNHPIKYEKMLNNLEADKALADRLGDPTIYYVGDIRITEVVPERSGIQRRLQRHMGISEDEVLLLLNNLDQFPKLRFEYCAWLNKSELKYDHE